MRKLISLCTSLCTMVLLFSAGPARADFALWVSPSGNDSNSCFETAPCATFQGAINKGNVAQINCLGSGYYGPFTITASITIDCGTGNVGNIVNTSGNAITINASSSAIVVLRHLSLNGLRGANSIYGINASFVSGTLIVEDCMIQGFINGFGIAFFPTGGRGQIQVSNTQIFGNAGGVAVQPSNGQIASATLNGVELVSNSAYGLVLSGSGVVAGTMRNSVAGQNAYGVYVDASQAYFSIENSSVVANPTVGIYTQSAGAVVTVGTTGIGANGTGVNASSGSIVSFGNNQMSANAADGNFTSTKALK